MTSPRILVATAYPLHENDRTFRSALALAHGGAEVTVLGVSREGWREQTRLGPVRVLRVPVAFRLRDAGAERLKGRQGPRALFTPADARESTLWALRANLAAAEARSLGGRRNQLRAAAYAIDKRRRTQQNRLTTLLAQRETSIRTQVRSWWDEHDQLVSWRRHAPELLDYELAFAPVVDRLDWDVLHVHGVHLMGTASQAVARRRAAGQDASWVYDARELLGRDGQGGDQRSALAHAAAEREYVGGAAAVLAPSRAMAERLQEVHSLARTPGVVMDTPVSYRARTEAPSVGVRHACGLAADVPLLVCVARAAYASSIRTVLEALRLTPGVHLSLVSPPDSRSLQVGSIESMVKDLELFDRVHVLDAVPLDELPAFASTADAGVVPVPPGGTTDWVLAPDVLTFADADLPVLTTDVGPQVELVRRHGLGGTYAADDPAAAAEAVAALLPRTGEVREHLARTADARGEHYWDQQAVELRAFYRDRLVGPGSLPEPSDTRADTLSVPETPHTRDDRPSVLGIGPANYAGQATAWARSLERHLPGVRAQVSVVDRGGPLLFPGDQTVTEHVYRSDRAWSQRFQNVAQETWTHALIEACRPLFGTRTGRDFIGDARLLRAVGVRVGLVMHGSEIRDPSRHATLTPWSPFRDPEDPMTAAHQRQRDRLAPKVRDYVVQGHGPVFVSTPDLLLDAPGSVWLPVTVDPAVWSSDRPVLGAGVPVVLHAPSRAAIKGSGAVDEVLSELQDRGLVRYHRIENVPPAQMPAAIQEADIVLDQFALGSYGAMACQAMAAGRIVLGHVLHEVRDAASDAARGMDLPIHEASPDTVADVIMDLVADPDRARASARSGQEFVRRVHDGTLASEVLVEHLGLLGG